MDYSFFNYSVPKSWYDNVYKDKVQCCSAARPFTLEHRKTTSECFLLIHGYRGYPGEMVRPAVDLFQAGYDVYVPRLPGCGTSYNDFIKSHGKDWLGLVQNAFNDLKSRYEKINLLGHSMGTAIITLIENDPQVGKIVYASPSFTNTQMGLFERLELFAASFFTPSIKYKWRSDSRFHLKYENAPCDDLYLGENYFQFFFTKQLHDYWRIMKKAAKHLGENTSDHLIIYPLKDHTISTPSVKILKEKLGDKAIVREIPNATHLVFYDIDSSAEEKAIQEILDFCK